MLIEYEAPYDSGPTQLMTVGDFKTGMLDLVKPSLVGVATYLLLKKATKKAKWIALGAGIGWLLVKSGAIKIPIPGWGTPHKAGWIGDPTSSIIQQDGQWYDMSIETDEPPFYQKISFEEAKRRQAAFEARG